MADKDGQTDFNKACTEFVRSALSILPSTAERLIYLAFLRDLETDQYQDRVLEALLSLKFGKNETDSVRQGERDIGLHCGKVELDRVLRQEHLAVFEEWLCLNLRQQMVQLECYAARQAIPPRTLFAEWIHRKSYERLAPSGALPVQRQLFLTDLETILTTLAWG
jgi:hypothetical protein